MSPWTLEHGPDAGAVIHLQTPDEFAALPDGTTLVCIDGTRATKGVDAIDGDTRCGHLAYGIPRAGGVP